MRLPPQMVCVLSHRLKRLIPDQIVNTLVQDAVSPGTTLFPISTPVSMALLFPVRFVIPSLYWKGFWSSRLG